VGRVNDAHLTRRLLLTGIGSAAVAAGLSACGSDSSKPPTQQAASPPASGPPVSARPVSAPPTAAPRQVDEPALRRKISSLLVVGFRGESLNQNDWIMQAVRNGLGGVILFDRDLQTDEVRNISSPGQAKALVKSLRDASPGGRLIVSIDQEGGQITRLNPSNGFPAIQSQAEIGAANNTATTQAWARTLVNELTSIGVNLNYTPVVDMNVNPNSPAIGQLGRSFSANADVVVKNATEEIQVHRAANVKTVLKHFPGSGSATGNTDFAAVNVSDTWHRNELEPFQKLIASGNADSIMAAHVVNTQLDPSGRPASLSRPIVTDLLRGQLGYRGPIVSDDMQAVAITSQFSGEQATTFAFEAGLDLLIFANQQVFNPNIIEETLKTVVNLVRRGQITEAQIDQAVARVDTLRPK
jgi:beta-N-acetylhexosaminidase